MGLFKKLRKKVAGIVKPIAGNTVAKAVTGVDLRKEERKEEAQRAMTEELVKNASELPPPPPVIPDVGAGEARSVGVVTVAEAEQVQRDREAQVLEFSRVLEEARADVEREARSGSAQIAAEREALARERAEFERQTMQAQAVGPAPLAEPGGAGQAIAAAGLGLAAYFLGR